MTNLSCDSRRTRVQTAAFLCRLNLDVAEENRAACFHNLGGANAAEDAINKTHTVNNCAGETGDPHHPRTVCASNIFEGLGC